MNWQMTMAMLHSNGQLKTERYGNTEKGCQKPAVQQKTTDDWRWEKWILAVAQIFQDYSYWQFDRLTLSVRSTVWSSSSRRATTTRSSWVESLRQSSSHWWSRSFAVDRCHIAGRSPSRRHSSTFLTVRYCFCIHVLVCLPDCKSWALVC